MKLFERLTKSKLDEMQEQKLARIERNISHMAIFGLLALFLIELFLFGYDWKIVGGEFILLMILCFMRSSPLSVPACGAATSPPPAETMCWPPWRRA